MREVTVTLIGKPGCHLCEQALAAITPILEETGAAFKELSLLDDPRLMAEYSEDIPVILIDGKVHDFLRVNPDRLRAAITKAQAQ